MAVFGDDELGDVGLFVAFLALIVVVGAVEEHDKVGVLLDGAGFTKVGEDRTRVVAAGDGAGELSQGDNGDF